jgi:hypothetical protein
MYLGNGSLALKELNERNTIFWRMQSELTLKQLSDETLFSWAKNDMDSEVARDIPLRSRKTVEKALADAADAKSLFQADFSRRGGMARKSDALQDLIAEIVRRRPAITAGQLLWELEGVSGAGIATRVESQANVLAGEARKIHFINYDERPKTASVSGLKFRLARAKRKMGMH